MMHAVSHDAFRVTARSNKCGNIVDATGSDGWDLFSSAQSNFIIIRHTFAFYLLLLYGRCV